MSFWDKFNETELPPKEAFYNNLSQTHFSDDDYERANIVWDHFKLKDLCEYLDLYLMNVVLLLLTDVFENFRNMCLEYYNLDQSHYYTLPIFAWDTMLLKTGVRLEQMHDLDMYEMVESGLRGGMCQVPHKHIKANNKYMNAYDDSMASSYISYLDANNLYGLAMSHKLPYEELRWSDDIKCADDVMLYGNGEYGYFVDVDLGYPKELHDLHSDYPLVPENMCVTSDMVSEFSKSIYKHYHHGEDVNDEHTKK